MDSKMKNHSSCWICLNWTDDENNHRGSTSFQMLMRYLFVDMRKVCEDSSKNNLKVQEKLFLCERCSLKVDEFWYLYQEFEAIRLSLDDCVQGLFTLIKKSEGEDEVQTRLNGDCRNGTTDKMRTLRTETLKKCAFRTTSVPRVQLRKLAVSRKILVDEVITTLNEGRISNCVIPIDETNTNEIQLNGKPYRQIVSPSSKELELEDSRRNRSKEMKQANLKTCKYCRFTSARMDHIRSHMLQTHTFEFYSDLIPSGITIAEVHAAIKLTVKNHLSHSSNVNRVKGATIKCTSCLSVLKKLCSLRVHILRCHFNEVADILKQKALTISNQSTEEMEVEVKYEPIMLSATNEPEADKDEFTKGEYEVEWCPKQEEN